MSKAKAKGHSLVYAQIGKPYCIIDGTPEGLLPPKNARWRLIYWNYIVFYTTKIAAEQRRDRLPYYQQEDAMIEEVPR